ncbi:hypothetical protein diail_11998 [Diaporthe ilicicola]|nr:hypothetical protein diail_11998 [Diaporthe ilicicola]
MDPDTIDALLERYLTLLDEYTTLRTKLSQLQTGMFQQLARANFSAERGMRYGPDFYDERMQALRQVSISTEGSLVPIFKVSRSSQGRDDNAHQDPPPDPPADELAEAPSEAGQASGDRVEREADSKKQNANDPLRWFGVLTPLSLRQTQTCAVEAVEQVIPRLVSLNAEMQDLEIQVRRARKKRAKERVASARLQEEQEQQAVTGEQLAAK